MRKGGASRRLYKAKGTKKREQFVGIEAFRLAKRLGAVGDAIGTAFAESPLCEVRFEIKKFGTSQVLAVVVAMKFFRRQKRRLLPVAAPRLRQLRRARTLGQSGQAMPYFRETAG